MPSHNPSTALPYPLNVYARLLELEEGQAEALHYGVYEQAHLSMLEAQRQAARLLENLLPPVNPIPAQEESPNSSASADAAARPCKILEVGSGLGATLAKLLAAGYQATGLSPDPQQIEIAQTRCGGNLPLMRTRLEDFADQAGTWDVLLLQESAQYIAPIDLFAQADRLLGARGEVILADEFAFQWTEPGPENLHQIEHFMALAERFGFSLVEKTDLSRKAAPTIDYILNALARHGDRLQAECALETGAMASLVASGQQYRRRYAEGIYGYLLLKFKRARHPRWKPGRIGAAQAGAMRTLFKTVFSEDMSQAHWQWKYGNDRGSAMGVWEGGELIAHYGGISRDIRYFGAKRRAVQNVDVMTSPQRGRSALSRKGPLFLAAASYLEHFVGYGNPCLVGFGFPSQRAFKAPHLLGLYGGPVAVMCELAWPSELGRPSMFTALRPLDFNNARHLQELDACWKLMAGDLGGMIIGARDGASLRQRFFAHPHKRYSCWLLRNRLTRRPIGAFVLNVPANAERCELLDVIAPLKEIPRCLHYARRVAAAKGAKELFIWVADNIADRFAPFAHRRDLEIKVPANIWTAGPPVDEQIGKWWLTGGDVDFR